MTWQMAGKAAGYYRQRAAGRCLGQKPLPACAHTHLLESSTMKAIWKNTVIAQSDDIVMVEGNHYFPVSALNREFVQFSNHRSSCAWKGQAHYYSLMVDGELNADCVWYYPDPKPEAASIRDRIAFWKGVQVSE